ncbi:MAG: bifunctional 4-hydroxy-2-oxoglutarate aldolase/2-dehydro-3-deoxy-phosphogluconate aldolase, partial [Candidatus Acidiferrales bacterium]
MTRAEVHERIEEIGIIPAVRASSAEDSRFASAAVFRGGIPIVEIAMTVPSALEVISHLLKTTPEMTVGAGSILDVETARRCVDAGAQFLTTDGLVLEVVKFAVKEHIVVFPGALTP